MNLPRKSGARWEMVVSLVMSLDCRFRLLIWTEDRWTGGWRDGWREGDLRAPPPACGSRIYTHHHLVHDGVATEDVVFPRVLLHVILDPRGLPRARQTHHDYDLRDVVKQEAKKFKKSHPVNQKRRCCNQEKGSAEPCRPHSRPWSGGPGAHALCRPRGSAAGR